MKHWIFLFSLTFILGTGLAGCINLGPDYQRPDLDIEIPESYQNDRTEQTANPFIADRWWQDFGDAELDVLVEEVLKRNWDLKQAAARIMEVRAQYVQVSADRWPQVGLDYDWDKHRFGGVNVSRGQTITTHQLTFPAFFEIDLWSRMAKASKAARFPAITLTGSWAVPEPIVVKNDGLFFEFKTKDTIYE
jgi:multidrug efflux system outer membrane protein